MLATTGVGRLQKTQCTRSMYEILLIKRTIFVQFKSKIVLSQVKIHIYLPLKILTLNISHYVTLLSLVLMLLVAGQSNVYAQQTWGWNTYGIAMDLPNDFEIVTNNENEFDAIGQGMELAMYVFKEAIALEDMDDATMAMASEWNLQEVDEVQSVDTGQFQGTYVDGYKDGDAVLLCGLIDPNSITNFFVIITFDDTDQVAQNDAFAILNSIRRSN